MGGSGMARFCGECGSAFREAERFCMDCGTPRGGVAAPAPAAATPAAATEPAESAEAPVSVEQEMAEGPDEQLAEAYAKEPEPESAARPAPAADPEPPLAPPSEEANAADAPDDRVCGACAEPLAPDSSFCAVCGAAADGSEPFAGASGDADDDGLVNGRVQLRSPLSLAIGAGLLVAFLVAAWTTYGDAMLASWQSEAPAYVDAAPAIEPEAPVSMAATDVAVASAAAPLPVASEAVEPALNGVYMAKIADQSVTMTFNGGYDRVLSETEGVAHYANTVTGRECASSFMARPGTRNGNTVVLEQAPIAGMPACDGKIDMALTVVPNGNSAAEAVEVRWLDPQGGKDLMIGALTRTSQ